MTLPLSEHFVADATPLMKIESVPGTYTLYKKIFSELHLPAEVADELARGPKLTREAYLKLYDLMDFVTVHRVQINETLQGILGLDRGEAEALSLAKSLGYPLLIEERQGRKVAKANALPFTGNGGLVLYGYAHGKLSKDEALFYLDALLKAQCFTRTLYQGLVETLQGM